MKIYKSKDSDIKWFFFLFKHFYFEIERLTAKYTNLSTVLIDFGIDLAHNKKDKEYGIKIELVILDTYFTFNLSTSDFYKFYDYLDDENESWIKL